MAVANTKSNGITTLDTGGLLPSRTLVGACSLKAVATLEVAAADDNNSVYRFFRLPSNAVVTSIKVSHDSITGGTDYDLGLYQTAENGGAVLDVNTFADAVDLSTGAKNVELLFEENAIENVEKKLYELAGLTCHRVMNEHLYLTCA